MRGSLRIPDSRYPGKELLQKRFPHRFLPSASAALLNACGMPIGVALAKIADIPPTCFLIKHLWLMPARRASGLSGVPSRLLSDRIAIPIRSDNGTSSFGMHFGPKCDKKAREVREA